MTEQDAMTRLSTLIARDGGEGPHIVGVLVVDETGEVGVSMATEDDVDILMLGIKSSRKSGPVVVEMALQSVTPTLEKA